MRDEERRRLIELAEKARGTALYEEINEQLYDSERVFKVVIELRVNDPMMELTSVNGFGDMVATEVMAELSPEWFSRYQGASWWVTKYRGYRMGYAKLEGWHDTEEPFPTPARSMNPHEGHDIRVLMMDQTWHDLEDDGTLGQAREVEGCDEIKRYCETCEQQINES